MRVRVERGRVAGSRRRRDAGCAGARRGAGADRAAVALLPARAEDTGDPLLRGRAVRRPVPTADFTGHDGRPNRLLGLPVRRRLAQAGEERGPRGSQVLEEAAIRRIRDVARQQAVGPRGQPPDRYREPVSAKLACARRVRIVRAARSTRRTPCGKRAAPRWAILSMNSRNRRILDSRS